ncbi:MBL fold metallo-hydrolase [Clostridium sp. CM028]|uniref:ComEC/Rec2 family competence protein n=1 Tax=unclassified Clostridium TaxID=2614128 RepID=UPI001C0D459F|nr:MULTISPECIES: ComEC/Rec2 family competence protein [unclassified Clostridium]MBU3091856.1 MBL fold metallo-hydrolase [Clostridium sp. CF011]MBW9145358.1 MBL fold metallo-hydrolase [Clostridium sp. CM027]MBW9148827.1 MBL fold metallo-hydrolase [Clostridium sp. CM028]UVE42496.1 MBL fold metallo-hydrolase [Clostridium sp. CM027]WAG71516.1 MBL fold metallo-hydrolase [Clostridium sp. CF011]
MPKKTWLKYILLCTVLVFISVCVTICHKSTIKTNLNLENNMVTHFIDVGQGDCILVQVNNKNLLIDSGTVDSTQKLIRYLKKNNVKKLDYVVATHPHEDHIGGMAKIIKTFDIDEFYAPKVISSSQSFVDMINSLRNKNLKIKVSAPNISLDLGPNTTCVMLSPNKTSYENTNNYSCTIKVSYKNSTYLFTGDIESLAEQELLDNGYNLKSQVLKVAHHGSKSSTSQEFLNKVSPKIAVISCGTYNTYGHPNKGTLAKLKKINSIVYRTDLDKNIILISDGTNINKKN